MILKKLGTEYKLYGEDNSCIATTQDSPHKRLSKENCDEIFEIFDAGKLAREYVDSHPDDFQYTSDEYWNSQVDFKNGFNKAMELNKDKLFTVEDIKKAFNAGWVQRHNEEGSHYENMETLIQSLQQPTEIEIEIVTHVDLAATPTDSRHPDAYLGTDTGIPFLDENGCLILKKK
jgi:hypothetical protein